MQRGVFGESLEDKVSGEPELQVIAEAVDAVGGNVQDAAGLVSLLHRGKIQGDARHVTVRPFLGLGVEPRFAEHMDVGLLILARWGVNIGHIREGDMATVADEVEAVAAYAGNFDDGMLHSIADVDNGNGNGNGNQDQMVFIGVKSAYQERKNESEWEILHGF